MDWQPIDTAPRDATVILACFANGELQVVYYAGGRWYSPKSEYWTIETPLYWTSVDWPAQLQRSR